MNSKCRSGLDLGSVLLAMGLKCLLYRVPEQGGMRIGGLFTAFSWCPRLFWVSYEVSQAHFVSDPMGMNRIRTAAGSHIIGTVAAGVRADIQGGPCQNVRY